MTLIVALELLSCILPSLLILEQHTPIVLVLLYVYTPPAGLYFSETAILK